MNKQSILLVFALLALSIGLAITYWIPRQGAASGSPPDGQRRTDRVSQFDALSSGARVAMFGDSLTARGEWSELFGQVVANRGMDGDTATQILKRTSSVPASAKTVFLMVGINDLSAGRKASDIATDTRRIVAALAPRRVILQSVLFVDDYNLSGAISDLNNQNRAYCATGACRYLELNDVLSRDGVLRHDLTNDGTHLVGQAYLLWASKARNVGL